MWEIKINISKSFTFLVVFTFCFQLHPSFTDGARIKGRFDRFGTTRNLLNADNLREPDAVMYYHHPDGAKITKSSHFEMEYELGRKIVFICTAEGKPRPHITWFKDGIELYAHRWLMISEWPHGQFKIKSKMEIDPATQMDRGEYECLADNNFAIDRRRFRTEYIEMD
ncbi:unnamed protein product [Orchesella dallaii]|uniref:Ig-like domain-containing protein n=1 Tax=Orchesella dallaii TaxID=48710 RepID=A0ABP1QIA7_9HEXA